MEFFSSVMTSEHDLCLVLLLSGGEQGSHSMCSSDTLKFLPISQGQEIQALWHFLHCCKQLTHLKLKPTARSTSVQESKLPRPKLLILVSSPNVAPISVRGEKNKNALMGAGSHSQLVSRLLSPLVMHHLLGALSLCQAQQELM